jgi:uncharacterized protein HemX
MKRPPATQSSQDNRLLLAVILLLGFAGAIGVGFVWLRHQIAATAENNRQMQQQLVDIQRRTAETNAEIAAVSSPEVLLNRNTSLKLGLEMPRDHQIQPVNDQVEVRLASKRNSDSFSTTFVSAALPLTTAR